MVTGLGEKAEFRSGRASNAPVRHLNFILQVKCVSNFSYFSKNSSKFYGVFFWPCLYTSCTVNIYLMFPLNQHFFFFTFNLKGNIKDD